MFISDALHVSYFSDCWLPSFAAEDRPTVGGISFAARGVGCLVDSFDPSIPGFEAVQ